jgi:tetratricopeptide (TPR) repeat protein
MVKQDLASLNLCFFFTLVLFLLAFPEMVSGQNSAVMGSFHQGNEYYRAGKYDQAIEKYLHIVRQGYRDPSLFYNLGNAYFKKGNLGKAILFYEKAKLFLPRDGDIQKNLSFANSMTIDKIGEESPVWLTTVWHSITFFLTLNELTVIFTGIYFFLSFLGVLAILKKKGMARKIACQLLIFFSILLIFAGGLFLYRIYHLKSSQAGVITSKIVEVKSGPENSLATLFSLHEGTAFSIQQKRGDWSQIMLKNGWSGWVQGKDMEKI